MTDDASADHISPAIVAALGEMDDIRRDHTADTGTFRYNYADLGSILSHVRPILKMYGLAVLQPVTIDDRGDVAVSTVLLHSSGQERTFPPLSMPAGRTPQAIGSAITYARRYALLAALGLATEDDDGAAATKEAKAKKPPARVTAAEIRRRPYDPAAPTIEAHVDSPPTAKQRGAAMAMFGELGYGGDAHRAARLEQTSGIVGHDIGSWNDLTISEADQVIDALRQRTRPPDDELDRLDALADEHDQIEDTKGQKP